MDKFTLSDELEKAVAVCKQRRNKESLDGTGEALEIGFRDGVVWVLRYLSFMPLDEVVEKIAEYIPPEPTCRVCGCTDDYACFAPGHGNCRWADKEKTICSHCADDGIFEKVTIRDSLWTTKL